MTLILTESDWQELYQQAPAPQPTNLALDNFYEVIGVPECLGQGYECSKELAPGIWLCFVDREFNQDWKLRVLAHEHPIEIGVFLSGFVYFDEIHPNLGGTRSYFSGSGISPAYVEKHRGGQYFKSVGVQILPELLSSFLLDQQQCSDISQLLFKGDDWKVSFYPTVTPAMRSLAEQMWNVPYQGVMQHIYLQGKVFELLAMQLHLIGAEPGSQPKPTTDCVYHARDILLANLENPPSVLELAQQVGVSACTLQRRFRELFGATVFGYLTKQRMALAEQLLRQGNYTVAEVAATVGYSNSAHFAAAFRRRYGITPTGCILGKKLVLR